MGKLARPYIQVLAALTSLCAIANQGWCQCETWEPLGSGIDGTVHATAIYNGQLIAAGSFTTAAGQTVNNIAKWDGLTWQPLGTGVNGTVHALAVYFSVLIVGGDFSIAGGQAVDNAAVWNGSEWVALGSGMNAPVLTLHKTDGNLLYAGGEFTFTNSFGDVVNYVAIWAQGAWRRIDYNYINGPGIGLNGPVHAIYRAPGGPLYAAGAFTTAEGDPAKHIARYSGTWNGMPNDNDDLNGVIRTLTTHNGDLIIGGEFTLASGEPANHIALWNDNDNIWEPLGSGMDGHVLSLAVREGTLIAGGSFDTAGGEAASKVAQWDGANWQAADIGLDGDVLSLTSHNGQVIAGGLFTTAGDASALGIAIWSDSSILSAPTTSIVGSGQAASFSVSVTDFAWSYQWRKNGVFLVDGGSISGANTSTLIINSASANDFGAYDVVVTNSCGSITSDPAALIITPVPVTCPSDNGPPGGDGVVDIQDIFAVIGTWGPCR